MIFPNVHQNYDGAEVLWLFPSHGLDIRRWLQLKTPCSHLAAFSSEGLDMLLVEPHVCRVSRNMLLEGVIE